MVVTWFVYDASMVELVYTMASNTIVERHEGSNPSTGTISKYIQVWLSRLDRLIWDQEAASSSLVTWIIYSTCRDREKV